MIAETYSQRIWNDKDLTAIDDLVHPDCIIHSLLGNFHGRAALKKIVQTWLKGFPDLHVKNIAVIADKDLVAIHWEANGTHQGEFKGVPASNKPISYAGVTIYRIRNGQIIEYWAYLDMQHLLKQIK